MNPLSPPPVSTPRSTFMLSGDVLARYLLDRGWTADPAPPGECALVSVDGTARVRFPRSVFESAQAGEACLLAAGAEGVSLSDLLTRLVEAEAAEDIGARYLRVHHLLEHLPNTLYEIMCFTLEKRDASDELYVATGQVMERALDSIGALSPACPPRALYALLDAWAEHWRAYEMRTEMRAPKPVGFAP